MQLQTETIPEPQAPSQEMPASAQPTEALPAAEPVSIEEPINVEEPVNDDDLDASGAGGILAAILVGLLR